MLADAHHRAPTPDLRIVMAGALRPHEVHDSQRAVPLIERLRNETHINNPPLVAPIGGGQFVILDGANRCYALKTLDYPHILVQVVAYDSPYVTLQTWSHVITGWHEAALLDALQQIPGVEVQQGQNRLAIAHFLLRDNRVIALCTKLDSARERNHVLRQIVSVYQTNARLHRTTLREPDDIWPLYEDSIALVVFSPYQQEDIIAAARYEALIPPGISRHIVHGRALHVNYPLAKLRDQHTGLATKNQELIRWLQHRLANRQVRYYAEATYQFDE